MPVALLTVLKLVVLGLLYLFLFRAVRALTADLYGPRQRRSQPPPRPSIADSATTRRSRRPPRELVIHPPEGEPRVIPLDEGAVTIGRSSRMTVRLEDAYVSDEHAMVRPDGDDWTVRDLGSTNGTYLNGAKVTQPTTIGAGDQLRLGKTRIEVRR